MRNLTTIFVLSLFMLTGLTACTTRNDLDNRQQVTTNTPRPVPGNVKSIQNPYNQNYDAAVDGKRPLAYTEDDVRSAIFTAKRIAKVANKVPGVTRASAVAQGIDIVVGVDGNGSVPAKELEKRVQQATQRAARGYNVYVTADPKLHNTIRSMNTNMTNVRSNHVTSGISKVIYEIGRTSGAK